MVQEWKNRAGLGGQVPLTVMIGDGNGPLIPEFETLEVQMLIHALVQYFKIVHNQLVTYEDDTE